eukprot:3661480-Amphidinium_carterae.1
MRLALGSPSDQISSGSSRQDICGICLLIKYMSDLLEIAFAIDFKHCSTSLFCWVPSPSNPADRASRLVVHDLLSEG